jgi:serine/threonine protein kinase
MNMQRSVTDENGRKYNLVRKLGSGGQGTVWGTDDQDFAIKLIQGNSKQKRDEIRQRIAAVKRMEFGRLPLARPLTALAAPDTGYVMELMSGLESLECLIRPARGQQATFRDYFTGSGGLLRRLRVLARAAALLSELHCLGYSYGDLSPGNIFISENVERYECWLIDCDNIRTATIGHSGSQIYTPGYGAPEVVQKLAPASTLSDAYSFAIIAYQVLTLTHPFLGKRVNEGEPELEELAFSGELPWVGDPDDDSNSGDFGVPAELVLSPVIRKLFQKTFGAGKSNPRARIFLDEWATSLFTAADMAIGCAGCSNQHFYLKRELKTCPWPGCDRPRSDLIWANLYLWDPAEPEYRKEITGLVLRSNREQEKTTPGSIPSVSRKKLAVAISSTRDSIEFTRRQVELRRPTSLDLDEVLCSVEADNQLLKFRNSSSMELGISRGSVDDPIARKLKVTPLPEGKTGSGELKPGKSVNLHFGALDEMHIYAEITREKE